MVLTNTIGLIFNLIMLFDGTCVCFCRTVNADTKFEIVRETSVFILNRSRILLKKDL